MISTSKKMMMCFLLSMNCLAGFAYTAVSSGKWSSAATWGGTTPGANVTLSDIDIPSGITVTLDQDVTFSGLLNTFTVNGSLDKSSTHWLKIDQGTLAGSGSIDIERLTFNTTASAMLFSGSINVNSFINNGSPLSVAAVMNVRDSFYLIGNTMQLVSGSNFTMGSNSLVIMWNGSMSVSGSGIWNTANSYDVGYAGTTQTTGMELNTPNLRQLFMWLNDTTQYLRLGSDVVVNNDLHLRTGKLAVNGKTLTLKHDVWRLNGSVLSSDANSTIIMEGDASMTDGLAFAPGSLIKDLVVDMKPYKLARLRSNLGVVGNLKLLNGNFSVEGGGTLTMNNNSNVYIDNGRLMMGGGSMASTGKYELEYVGAADTIGPEIQCGGLYDLTISLASDTGKLVLQNDLSIGGKFDMRKGHLALSGNDVMMNGTFSQNPGASMIGSQNSDIEMHLTTGDTLFMDVKNNVLHNLKIDIRDAGTMILGSDLYINSRLDLNKGKIDIGNHDLFIGKSATVNGFSDQSYIVTSGSGRLQMNVNAGGSYVVFPVGTKSQYSPAKLQQATGSVSGNFLVSVSEGVLSKADIGYNTAVDHSVVNRTWKIGADQVVNVNLNLKLGWNSADEVNGFNRNRSFITHFDNIRWDVYPTSAAQSISGNMFEQGRTGFTSTGYFAVADTTSALAVTSAELTAGISLFPNPATERLTLEGMQDGDEYSIELADFTGRVIARFNTSENLYGIDIAELVSGNYFVKITNIHTNAIAVKPFIKN